MSKMIKKGLPRISRIFTNQIIAHGFYGLKWFTRISSHYCHPDEGRIRLVTRQRLTYVRSYLMRSFSGNDNFQ
ncbi:hypothetical protein KHA90_11480 [Flavobacterium psychroterrae]|uniref:Uncharacterized protein n=1 Tax=Flavobacterium psychroterrae TaxID=2133767 RepID=A0ABS5PC09_9FLAO|nr:hypothetical protein [Flavobacterium psychroterrae]